MILFTEEPCVLYCKNEAGSSVRLAARAKDGTPCKHGTRNVCIATICRVCWIILITQFNTDLCVSFLFKQSTYSQSIGLFINTLQITSDSQSYFSTESVEMNRRQITLSICVRCLYILDLMSAAYLKEIFCKNKRI